MPDRDKVIKGLEYHLKELSVGKTCFECPYYGDNPCEIQLIADAIALLKEQEPVEPVLMREGRNEYYNDYVCPECDNELVFGQNFCSECGRQVKWDGRT